MTERGIVGGDDSREANASENEPENADVAETEADIADVAETEADIAVGADEAHAETETEVVDVGDAAETEADVADAAETETEAEAEGAHAETEADVADAAETEIDAAKSTTSKVIGTRQWVLIGALSALVALATIWGIAEALEVKGDLVAGTLLAPEPYLAQVVPVEVDGVEHHYTLAELGWTTNATETLTGGLFSRLRLHSPTGPSGGPAESPVVLAYRSELDRDPTVPTIDAAWNVVEGQPGVATEVEVVGSIPPLLIDISTAEVEPESSARLQWFVNQRNRDVEGWEIRLLDADGILGATISAEEVAAHIRFDRKAVEVNIVDDTGFRALLEERIRPFVRDGQRARLEIGATDDDATLVIRGGRLNVLDVVTESQPGKVPDLDRAWSDLVDVVQTFGRMVAVRLIDADDLYGGVDPADLTVKLAESRTPNTGGSRMTNIRNVLNATRGVVVEPGGVFGLNQTVGRRTAEKGYVVAGAIANGEHVEAFGGGVSQTATMFYQAAYMAGLTFPEREGGGIGGGHQAFGHSEGFGRYNNYYAEGWGLDGQMETGRLGYGVEQTVNWPNREAGFINTTPHPILVWTFDTGKHVGVSLWSLERNRFGVYEGTDSWRRGSCIDWTHSRTVYDMDDNVLFEDSYNGFYRTQGPTCAFEKPDPDDE